MTEVHSYIQTKEEEEEEAQVRAVATLRLQQLREEALAAPPPPSWVHPSSSSTDRSEAARFFDTNGFLHVPSFVTEHVVQSMKEEMAQLIETQWDITASDTFGTSAEENVARGRYFLESDARVHFFDEPQKEEEENARPVLNKAGHGLHTRSPPSAFSSYTQSDAVRALVRDLGWRDPVVPQSMYICKHAQGVGGVVHSHQDSTFLFTTPRPTCLGLWLALDDATLTNGCLWLRPGSMKEPVRRQYVRNVQYFGTDTIQQRSNVASGDTTQTMFEMRTLCVDPAVPWDGSLPGTNGDWASLLKVGFVPVECKAGDLLAFCGTLDHLSLTNRTASARRDTFQLHIVEGPSQGIEWSPLNWLQYPPDQSFVRLNAAVSDRL